MGDIGDFAPAQIMEEIKAAGETFRLLQNQREAMKEIEVDERIMSELIGRMFLEQNLIGSTQLNILKREIKDPTFDYGDKASLWTLYQHTTFSMREIHPRVYMDDHMKMHRFFMKEGMESAAERVLTRKGLKAILGSTSESLLTQPSVDPRQLDLVEELRKIEENEDDNGYSI